MVGSRDLLSFWWFWSNRNLSLVLICNSPTFPQLLVPNFPRIRRFSARISAQIEEQPADLIATGSSARKDRKFRPGTGSSAPQDRKFRLAEILTAFFVFRFGTNPLCLDFVVCAISATTKLPQHQLRRRHPEDPSGSFDTFHHSKFNIVGHHHQVV